jgi:hypothetical protein
MFCVRRQGVSGLRSFRVSSREKPIVARVAVGLSLLGLGCGAQSPRARVETATAPAPPIAVAPASDTHGGAATLGLLQSSPLKLPEDGLAHLRRDGFVIDGRHRFPSFTDGWIAVFKADLPLYVSADSLLHVVHRSYDAILAALERDALVPALETMLTGMRAHLAGAEGATLTPTMRVDADVFTGVALALLEGKPTSPVAGADESNLKTLVDLAYAASGLENVALFGGRRRVDFSQFKPRGHYLGGEFAVAQGGNEAPLTRYFRAIAWLGRIEIGIADAHRNADGTVDLELARRQLELTAALRAIMGEPERTAWRTLDAAMGTFVGEPDAMSPPDVDRLYADLHVQTPTQLAALPDPALLAAVKAGHYGEQRIQGGLVDEGLHGPTPLPRAFSFIGQRYILDSHVFSNLVHDRVPGRLMPNPLDVAYAVFDDADAQPLLANDLANPQYRTQLEAEHDRVARDAKGWDANLYDLWLGAIRALSPSVQPRLPAAIRPEAWGRRILGTQLASWAELRHDTLLYAKQSYTVSIGCSYPDAFVDPYPLFFSRLAAFASKGGALVAALDFGPASREKAGINTFFGRLYDATLRLGQMAERELRGKPLTADDLAFLNHAVAEEEVPGGISCGGPPPRSIHGWYVDLFYGTDPLASLPTIADVHTQPTDAGGNLVGRVLHVGTGQPRIIVVDVGDGRGEVRPYVGVVSSYAEEIRGDFQRYNDEEWRRKVWTQPPEDVPWLRDVVVR